MIFAYIRCFFKRLTCERKIKKLCRSKGYKMYPTHPLWFFGGKRTRKCDLHIETANEVFSVKLFGVAKRTSVLILKENGEYFIRGYVAMISFGQGIRYPIDGKPAPMPIYDFRYRYRDAWEIKTPRRVLLVNPVSMEFLRQPHLGSEVRVDAGDIVNGMEIDSLPRLLGDLEGAL